MRTSINLAVSGIEVRAGVAVGDGRATWRETTLKKEIENFTKRKRSFIFYKNKTTFLNISFPQPGNEPAENTTYYRLNLSNRHVQFNKRKTMKDKISQ